ncbi:hypothetical protein BDW59DRAFT_164416 [Aspergillus cavernicola]|uniref:CorA-like transporter domain-containing protein n=1 Tax=Aspergillus cavernicola TaxID=176166 RepID=A0ABR4HZU4_9EURO
MEQAMPSHDQSVLSRFESIANKLFSRDKIEILLFWSERKVSGNSWYTSDAMVNSSVGLQEHLDAHVSGLSSNLIIMIPQEYSWGRLCTTDSAFRLIMDSMKIFPSFLELTGAFGFKTNADERVFHGWRGCALSGQCLEQKHEICYNIQYVEKHGRKLKDPWSLRQTGVYHQDRGSANQSRWILINPSDVLKPQITGLVGTEAGKGNSDQDGTGSWALHIQLLLKLGSNWAEYIEYLGSELGAQNDKACYSRVDCSKDQSYTLSYADLQELHMLQAKFQTAEATVNSCLSNAKGCRIHLQAHAELQCGPRLNWGLIFHLFDTYEADMVGHLTQLQALQARLKSTLGLLTKLIMFRNEELLHTSNQASCKSLKALLDLTGQGKQQQETLNGLLWHGHADSAMLKALSVVATVCLPASLVATIFSSNLVQSRDPQAGDGDSRLVVSPQFWVYIAISLPLMGFVLIWVLYLGYKSRQAMSAKLKGVV